MPKHEKSQKLAALVVGGGAGERVLLRKIFRDSAWTLFEARNRAEAVNFLAAHPVQVVVSDRDLPDCTWRELLDALRVLPGPPMLVVTSRLADEFLWAEVLNMGGYDVLAQPFRTEEVVRVLGGAQRRFQNESERSTKPLALTA